ncbi:GPW/gp25 family protein [Yoonia sp. I 8.24]|uniref:GPW/gp25 family protein n=1 Tax=Yoonia sp. I 8.24 TaxID=1537229 RepID=UPI001EDFC9AA|nr:GPW/gp25 family protein [Yoonia sp. I 8.24]
MDLNHHTGAVISGWSHVVQSIETILATRVNTRVFMRQFGSDVPAMVDMPMNDANIMALYVSVAEAIDTWEPRFALTDVTISADADGVLTLNLTGNHLPNAHLGDATIVDDGTQVVRVQTTGVDNWSLTA